MTASLLLRTKISSWYVLNITFLLDLYHTCIDLQKISFKALFSFKHHLQPASFFINSVNNYSRLLSILFFSLLVSFVFTSKSSLKSFPPNLHSDKHLLHWINESFYRNVQPKNWCLLYPVICWFTFAHEYFSIADNFFVAGSIKSIPSVILNCYPYFEFALKHYFASKFAAWQQHSVLCHLQYAVIIFLANYSLNSSNSYNS